MKFIHKNIIMIGFVIWFLPILPAVIIGFPLAHIFNCQDNGFQLAGCARFGVDITDFLNILGFIPWFGIFTFPIGIITIIIGLFLKSGQKAVK